MLQYCVTKFGCYFEQCVRYSVSVRFYVNRSHRYTMYLFFNVLSVPSILSLYRYRYDCSMYNKRRDRPCSLYTVLSRLVHCKKAIQIPMWTTETQDRLTPMGLGEIQPARCLILRQFLY